MTSSAPLSLTDDNSTMPLARIDTQDVEFVIPLREYLESNGCRVHINSKENMDATYVIAVGDADFVKTIVARTSNGAMRWLGIVIGFTGNADPFASSDDVKIVFVDAVYLSQKDVLEIFSFFFAGIAKFCDKRRTHHEPSTVAAVAPSDAQATPQRSGEVRVADVLVPHEPVSRMQSPAEVSHRISSVQKNELLDSSDKRRIGSIMNEVFGDTKKKRKNAIVVYRKNFSDLFQRYATTIGIFICILCMPVVWYYSSLMAAVIFFGNSGVQLKSGSSEKAIRYSSIGRYWLSQSKFSFSIMKLPFVLFGAMDFTRGNERILSLLSDVSDMFDDVQNITSQVKQVSLFMKGSQTDSSGISPAALFDLLRRTTEETHNRLGLAEAQLQVLIRDQTFPFGIPAISKKSTDIVHEFQSARNILSYVNTSLLLYPGIAGFSQPKTYMVLLQNSNELRPTGGFIGSVGIAKFQDGLLSDFSIQDVYALDGQLKGHVDPPKPIRELLSQEHWYLRDSNWSPDFKTSAQQAAWFYQKETGVTVDGVVGVNVPFVVDVLAAIGPVQLPDYNDRITADNFFGKSFYYTQHDFFPGSTQKKDFLGTLFRAIMSKIMTDSDASSVGLFTAFTKGIVKRDIAIMSQDKELQSIIEHFGWGGRVFSDEGCAGVDPSYCLYDPVAISEANVSVSKINYFISRSAEREVSIAPDGSMSEALHIYVSNTVNTSPDANTPGIGGAYRAYMRFILPDDSIITDVRVDNQKVLSRDKADTIIRDVPYIETASGPEGTHSVGVAFAVSPGVKNNILISYTRGKKLRFGKAGAVYDATWYKQPGVNSVDLKTTIRYPLFWVASNIPTGEASPFIAKDGQLEYNTQVQTDEMIRIKFTP